MSFVILRIQDSTDREEHGPSVKIVAKTGSYEAARQMIMEDFTKVVESGNTEPITGHMEIHRVQE